MKINVGKIRNINKKILAGTFALTILTTPLTGCFHKYNEFEYQKNDQGIVYSIDGTVDYNIFKNYCFTIIEDKTFKTVEFYIARRFIKDPTVVESKQEYYYIDVLTDRKVFSRYKNSSGHSEEKNNRYLIIDPILENYLYNLEEVKESYTIEDVQIILNKLKTKYYNTNTGQLSKGK